MRRILLSLLAVSLAGAAIGAERKLVEGIVVRVNERILTIEDMRDRVREKEAEAGTKVLPEMYPAVVREAADELVLLERAEELKLEVDEKEVDTALAQLKAGNKVADDATFEKMLNEAGISLAQLRARLRDTILINRVLTKELGSFEITEEELRQRYERDKDSFMMPPKVHIAHVVYQTAVDPAAQEQVVERARRLVAAARSGSDFLTLAQEETGAGGAVGGDLGILALDDLRSEVRDVTEKLAPGEVSEPFETPAGLHVVLLIERIPAAPRPFDEVKDSLRQAELSERYRGRLGSVVEELKKRYVVEVRPEMFAPAQATTAATNPAAQP